MGLNVTSRPGGFERSVIDPPEGSIWGGSNFDEFRRFWGPKSVPDPPNHEGRMGRGGWGFPGPLFGVFRNDQKGVVRGASLGPSGGVGA